MTKQREGAHKRRKSSSESWEHADAKWSVSYILHELGFKVFIEPTLVVKGRSVRPDLIAIKEHAAIVVEIGKLQRRSITFKDLYISIQREYRDFKIKHVIFCNPLTEKFDYLLNIDSTDFPGILEMIERRKEPQRTLHFRESY